MATRIYGRVRRVPVSSLVSCAARVTRDPFPDFRYGLQHPPHRRDDVLDSEAEEFEQLGAGADSPKLSMPTTSPSRPDILAPVIGDAGFDRDARTCRAAKRSRDTPRPDDRRRSCTASTRRALRCLLRRASLSRPARAALPSRCAMITRVRDSARRRARSRRAGCSRSPRRYGFWNGTFWRLKSSALGPSRRSIAAAQATTDSTVSHGRHTSMFGMSRRLAACSTA